MVEKLFELILGDREAQFIRSIDHKNDCFTLSVVVLPERPVLALSRHVKRCKANLVFVECFNLETNSGSQLLLLVLLRLQEVYHGGLSRVV